MAEQPIIVKKIIKKGHAHHGGAWKLAYADFVTAMMAFFLLMWLLGSTDEVTKKGIAEYFQDPYEASRIDKGLVPTLDELDPTELDKQSEQEDKVKLEMLRLKIEKMLDENKKLEDFKEQVKLDITPEGLRVQIVDDKNQPMFKLGSSEAEPQIRTILRSLAPVINELPNKISVNGHTDSKPFAKFSKLYSNWELSSERANAARRELAAGGYDETKILRVSGLSDSIPLNEKDPLAPVNRRISIIVMNKKTELQLLEDAGNQKPAEGGAAPAEGGHGAAPAEGGHGEAPASGHEAPKAEGEAAPAHGEEAPKAEPEAPAAEKPPEAAAPAEH